MHKIYHMTRKAWLSYLCQSRYLSSAGHKMEVHYQNLFGVIVADIMCVKNSGQLQFQYLAELGEDMKAISCVGMVVVWCAAARVILAPPTIMFRVRELRINQQGYRFNSQKRSVVVGSFVHVKVQYSEPNNIWIHLKNGYFLIDIEELWSYHLELEYWSFFLTNTHIVCPLIFLIWVYSTIISYSVEGAVRSAIMKL